MVFYALHGREPVAEVQYEAQISEREDEGTLESPQVHVEEL